MNHQSHEHDTRLIERMEGLRAQGEKMKVDAIQAKTRLEHARSELQKLKQEAEKEFGTSDPVKLNELLVKWRQENKTALDEYERVLSETAAKLSELEKVLG